MRQITVIIEDDQLEKLEEIADNQDSSRNEVLRNVLELGFNYRESENQTEDKLEELRNEKNQVIDKLRQEKKELEDKLKQTNQRINATNELLTMLKRNVSYIERNGVVIERRSRLQFGGVLSGSCLVFQKTYRMGK